MIMKEVDPNKLIPHNESTKKAYMVIIPNHRKLHSTTTSHKCFLLINKFMSTNTTTIKSPSGPLTH